VHVRGVEKQLLEKTYFIQTRSVEEVENNFVKLW